MLQRQCAHDKTKIEKHNVNCNVTQNWNFSQVNDDDKKINSGKTAFRERKTEVHGEISELGSNVYCCDMWTQFKHHNATTENKVEHLGYFHNRNMCDLLSNGTKLSFDEPPMDVSEAKLLKHEKELSHHHG